MLDRCLERLRRKASQRTLRSFCCLSWFSVNLSNKLDNVALDAAADGAVLATSVVSIVAEWGSVGDVTRETRDEAPRAETVRWSLAVMARADDGLRLFIRFEGDR